MHLVAGAEGSEQRQRRHSRGRRAAAASAATTRLCSQHRLLHSTLRAQCRRGLNKLSAARRPIRGEARLSVAKLGAKRRGSTLAELVAARELEGTLARLSSGPDERLLRDARAHAKRLSLGSAATQPRELVRLLAHKTRLVAELARELVNGQALLRRRGARRRPKTTPDVAHDGERRRGGGLDRAEATHELRERLAVAADRRENRRQRRRRRRRRLSHRRWRRQRRRCHKTCYCRRRRSSRSRRRCSWR